MNVKASSSCMEKRKGYKYPLRQKIFKYAILLWQSLGTGIISSENKEKLIQPDIKDRELAEIICEAYQDMIEKTKKIEGPYQIGEMWDKIITNIKGEFYAPIKAKDIDGTSKMLANFFRTDAIIGLWEGGAYTRLMKNFMQRFSFIIATLRNYDFWQVLTNNPLDTVNLPNVGNPFGYNLNGNIVSIAQFKLHYHAQQVHNLISDIKYPVISEIGAGFGGIGYYLFKEGFKGTYIIFDIPETLILAIYFLMKAFPDKKILNYSGQKSIMQSDIENYDIILMPNFMLKNLPDLCVDLIINTRSFSEMPIITLQEYMLQIDRICKKYIYHDNANYKSHSHEIPAPEFPVPISFKLLTKVKSLWYGGFTAHNRFVEYLYLRNQ